MPQNAEGNLDWNDSQRWWVELRAALLGPRPPERDAAPPRGEAIDAPPTCLAGALVFRPCLLRQTAPGAVQSIRAKASGKDGPPLPRSVDDAFWEAEAPTWSGAETLDYQRVPRAEDLAELDPRRTFEAAARLEARDATLRRLFRQLPFLILSGAVHPDRDALRWPPRTQHAAWATEAPGVVAGHETRGHPPAPGHPPARLELLLACSDGKPSRDLARTIIELPLRAPTHPRQSRGRPATALSVDNLIVQFDQWRAEVAGRRQIVSHAVLLPDLGTLVPSSLSHDDAQRIASVQLPGWLTQAPVVEAIALLNRLGACRFRPSRLLRGRPEAPGWTCSYWAVELEAPPTAHGVARLARAMGADVRVRRDGRYAWTVQGFAKSQAQFARWVASLGLPSLAGAGVRIAPYSAKVADFILRTDTTRRERTTLHTEPPAKATAPAPPLARGGVAAATAIALVDAPDASDGELVRRVGALLHTPDFADGDLVGRWALRHRSSGIVDLIRGERPSPSTVTRAVAAALTTGGGFAFVRDRTRLGLEGTWSRSADLFATYRAWRQAGGQEAVSAKAFGMALDTLGLEKKRTSGSRRWSGVAIPAG